MPVLEILQYPHPMLREKCRYLSPEEIRSDAIQTLIRDMIETMYAFEGTVGLAAPQVGHPVHLMVIDALAKTTRDKLKVIINAEIIQQSQWKYAREGCLSFPEYLVTVKRARKVTGTYYDQTGTLQTEPFRDFEAVILQHEADHLEGILFIDRLQNPETDLILRSSLNPV